MKWKIKIKVKHLFYWLLSIVLILALFHWVIIPQTGVYLASKHSEKNKPDAKERILKNLNSSKILDAQKMKLIEKYMLSDYSLYNQFPVTISPGMYGSNTEEGQVHFTWEEKLPFIKKYLAKGSVDDMAFAPTVIQLARYYAGNNQLKQANQTLMDAIKRAEQDGKAYVGDELYAAQLQITIDHDRGNYQNAKQLLQQLRSDRADDDYYFQGMLDAKEVRMTLQQGHTKKAYKLAKKALENYEAKSLMASQKDDSEGEAEDDNTELDDVHGKLFTLKKQLERALSHDEYETSTVKGRVTRNDGTPVANAGVFLRQGEQNSSSISPDEPYQQITDANGYYTFKGVLPDNYQITLGLTFDQVDGWTWAVDMNDWIDTKGQNKVNYDIVMRPLIDIHTPANEQKITGKTVHFAWDKVPSAAYYALDVGASFADGGGSSSTTLKTHITDNEITVRIEELYNQQIGASYPNEDSKFASAESLLAFTHTNNRFNWYVEAYDAKGNMLSRSDGFRLDKHETGNVPFFYLQEREMSEADKLLIKKKPKKALEAYRKKAASNPNDIQSLRMITRMTESQVMDHPSNKAEQQLIPYVKALAEKTHAPDTVRRLLEYYEKKRDWSAYDKWFAIYQKANDGYLDGYDQSTHAKVLLKQGKWQSGLKEFQDAIPRDKSHGLIGDWLAVSLYLDNGYDKALSIAKSYPQRPIGDTPPDWPNLIRHMQQEGKGDASYQQTLQRVVRLHYDGKNRELKKWLQTTDLHALKKFMTALQDLD